MSLYDKDKIVGCFESEEQWRDEADEIIAMQMSYRSHALMMGKVVDTFFDVVERNHGAATVLDVGCGTAMFLDYVREQYGLHRVERYVGYELVTRFGEKAAQKLEDYGVRGAIVGADFFDLGTTAAPADLVIASQCLNTVFSDDPLAFIAMAVDQLWSMTRHSLVFDLKDVAAPRILDPHLRTYYDPVYVYKVCRDHTVNVTVSQTTKANFTVVMSREELY